MVITKRGEREGDSPVLQLPSCVECPDSGLAAVTNDQPYPVAVGGPNDAIKMQSSLVSNGFPYSYQTDIRGTVVNLSERPGRLK